MFYFNLGLMIEAYATVLLMVKDLVIILLKFMTAYFKEFSLLINAAVLYDFKLFGSSI